MLVAFSDTVETREQFGCEKVDVMNARMIQRSVTEAVAFAFSPAIDSIKQEPATAGCDFKRAAAIGFFIPIEKGMRGKDRTHHVGRAARRKESARLPVEVVPP